MQTATDLARRVYEAWAAPRRHAPSATLEYCAEQAYWQAVNLCGFVGDLEAWLSAVRRAGAGAPLMEDAVILRGARSNADDALGAVAYEAAKRAVDAAAALDSDVNPYEGEL